MQLKAGLHSPPPGGYGKAGGGAKSPGQTPGPGRTNVQTDGHTHNAKPIHQRYAGCNESTVVNVPLQVD